MKTFLDPRVLVTVLLFGCPFAGDGRLDQVRDVDGDHDPGIAFGGHDCDDTNPAVNSFATEDWSNDIDDDCDGNAFDQDGDGFQRDVDCDDTDPGVNVDQTWYADADGDGFRAMIGVVSCAPPGEGWLAEQGTDCDDQDATSFPRPQESQCDGVDNDCDGEIDESDDVPYTSWWPDADGDLYGDRRATPVSTCDGPPADHYADNQLDCDDGDDERSPVAPEICDGVDNDCDDATDEPDDVTWTTYWPDRDGDGAGYSGWTDPGTPAFAGSAGLRSCDAVAPPGYADNPDDCDDDDASVTTFTWYSDQDGDGYGAGSALGEGCSGPVGAVANVDDCDDTDAEENPAALWYDDLDGDGFGAGDAESDCTRPAGKVVDATDCDDTDADVYPGAPGEQVHDGVDTNCDDGTEFDGPDPDTLPDLPCSPIQVSDVYPGTVQGELHAGDCRVLRLHVDAAQPAYGPVTLPAGTFALVGAPYEDVVFVSPIGGSAITGPRNTPIDLLVEKVGFQGWDTAISLYGGSLRLSEVVVSEGEAVSLVTDGSSLSIFDSGFSGVDLIYDPSWAGGGQFADVRVERVMAALAVAPHTVLTGGTSSTLWRDLVVTNSAAIVSLLQVPGDRSLGVADPDRTIEIDGLVVRDSLGRALDVVANEGDAITLTDVALDGNIVVDRGLLAIEGAGASLSSVSVSGLTGRDNTMEVFSATQSDLRSRAMFDLGPGESTLQDVVLTGNVTNESWLLQGKGTGSNLILAGVGERGLRFGGELDHATLVGFGYGGADFVDTLFVNTLTLRDTLIADVRHDVPLVGVQLDRVFVAPNAVVTCSALEPTCKEGVDPKFLRYDPKAPSEFWDFRVVPTSPAIASAGSCQLPGACDLGGLTPTTAPLLYVDLDIDGLYDTWEAQFFGDPTQCLPGSNPDGDGFTTGQEFLSGTLPTMADFDLDGLPDGPKDGAGGTWDDLPWDPAGG